MNLVIQRVSRAQAPHDAQLALWLKPALPAGETRELVLRIVDEDESQALNKTWRGKDAPTNVLSFPADPLPPELAAEQALGDLVVCAPVVAREASEQGKSLDAHWAHMLIHGCLHLQGHDHQNEDEADRMENLERQLLAQLNFPDPYE